MLRFFLDFNKRLVQLYPQVFKERDDDGQDAESFSTRTAFGKQWGWYQTIYAIANGQLTNFKSVVRLPLHECLTWLSFERQKRDIENNEMQRQLNKMKR